MIYVLYTIHVLICLFLILVVLLQQGKGADLSVFGGGATQAAFGARGAVSLLHKLTVWGFVAFIGTTISIGFMTSSARTSSVMSDVPAVEQTVPATSEATGSELEGESLAPVEPAAGADGEEATDDATGSTEAGDGNLESVTEEPASAEEDAGDADEGEGGSG